MDVSSSSSSSSSSNNSEICNFFKQKSIFITGATGFLGKALVEKLLRECFDLKKIYILMRHKNNKSPSERTTDFFKDEVYCCKKII